MQAANSKIEEQDKVNQEKEQTIESLNELLAQANQDLRHEREARRAEIEKVCGASRKRGGGKKECR